jgi:hypothetical protein
MHSHRSDQIAVISGGMYNPLYARMLAKFAIELHASGRQILLAPVDSGRSIDSILPRLASYRNRRDRQRSPVLPPEARPL